MLSIENYLLEYKRKLPTMLFLWMMILTFIIISLVTINKLVTIKNYYLNEGIIKDKSVIIYVSVKDLYKVVNNSTLYINNRKYNYKIQKISEEIITNNNNFYKEITLYVNLDYKLLIDNNIVELKFIVNEMTIFEYIVNLIKGE